MFLKRLFDIVFSLLLLLFLSPVLFISYLLACTDTCSLGVFSQKRVGRYGRLFTIYKLKTIHPGTGEISGTGSFLRKYKIDELPQLFNVMAGNMSLVGPRPDVEGYYDKLKGAERKLLELKPGMTSPAALKYKNEEQLLSQQKDAVRFNDEVLFPDKVKMNLEYYHQLSLKTDIRIIIKTVRVLFRKD